MKNYEKGITLMALVVTIVVLLILAGITIRTLTGDDGLIRNSKDAKEDAEIANEREILDIATVEAIGKNKYGDLEEEEFQDALDKQTGGKAKVTDIGGSFEVLFIDSKRYYAVDGNGNIGDLLVAVTDPYPGDITKDENGNILDGTSSNPYQINCVEDLVALSNMVNNTGKIFKDGQITDANGYGAMSGKYIVLTRDLNFKSSASYVDSQRTDFEDINGNDADGNILITEMTTGMGFRPIGTRINGGNNMFGGNFDGNNHKLENIYINYEGQERNYDTGVGLFGFGASTTTISNLEISGEIKGSCHTGGIIGGNCKSIDNCINRANITGFNMVGGICAKPSINITNCTNYGTINITGQSYGYGGAGGIEGHMSSGNTIKNCTNKGDIVGNTIGGIVGCVFFTNNIETNIINCSNEGKCGAGIVSFMREGTVNIINCFNAGECNNGIVSTLAGGDWNAEIELNIQNSYNLGKVSNAGILGEQGRICKTNVLNIENCYNAGESKKAIIASISTDSRTETNIKNTYYDKTKSSEIGAVTDGIEEISIYNNESFVSLLNSNIVNNTNWNKLELGENGYPVFVKN